jgi:N-acetylglutamate synthase-like GNAT family acetyltransferase
MEFKWLSDEKMVDLDELSELYRIAPLGNKPPEHLQVIFANSRFKWFAYQDHQLAGVGRALADGLDCSYICDVAVHPDLQGKGLGKQIVNRLIDDSKGHSKIILYANPGKEGFYKKLGFKMMNTAMAIFADQERALKNGVVRGD